jgi:hypothetical protein
MSPSLRTLESAMHLASSEGRTWNACCLSLRPKERNIGSLLTGAKASDKRRSLTRLGDAPKSCQSSDGFLVNLRCISTVAARV